MRFLILFIFLISGFSFASSVYVNNENSASGNGSFNNPFNSIDDAFSVLQAGDTLFVRGGQNGQPQYYNENLSLGSSTPDGTESQPIVVKNYNNETVSIRLSDSFSIYSDWWVFEGLTFDMGGQADDVIKPKGDHLVFRNCVITDGQRDGFDINGANYLLIENCKIFEFRRNDQYDAHGIILNGGTGNTFRNNEIYDCKGDCIQLYKEDQNYDTLIEGNNLYTTLGGGSENAIDLKATQGCTIRNNKMHGFHDSDDSDGVALKINKDSDNLVIEGNDIYECNGGFRISGSETANIIFRSNSVHDLHADGGDVSKYGYGIQFDGVDQIEISNNTFANIPGPLFWIASRGATDITMKNNLFYNSNDFKGSTSDFDGNVYIDYNGWFKCAEQINGGGNNVVADDPGFKNAAARDYQLHDGSPAIDKGDPADGAGYPGGRIDLGAFEYETTTSANSNDLNIPAFFELKQNYPNPFNPQTTLSYNLPGKGHVTLAVYNILGQRVALLLDQVEHPGVYRLNWNAEDFPGGVYFCQLTFNNQSQTRRMVLVK